MWAATLTAFPVVSGVIVAISNADSTSARLIQVAVMSLSAAVACVYCKVLLTKNLIPLMVFHCRLDFFTYQMSATGTATVIVYAVSKTLMTILAVYLVIALVRRSKTAVSAGVDVAARKALKPY